MAIEIERKFLVRPDAWRADVCARARLRQGYLANTGLSSVRVRLAGDRGWLSVKSMTPGIVRSEYEYPVPRADAEQMLDSLCEGAQIEKIRHIVDAGRHRFEVDEFLGRNQGLVVAEIELGAPDEPFERPAWLGDEVTDALRYYNFRLVVEPFDTWPAALREATIAGRSALQDEGGHR